MDQRPGVRLPDDDDAIERYQALVELSAHAVWDTDPRGRVLYANPWWLDYCGLSFEQMRGDGWVRTIHPDHAARARRVGAEAIRSGKAYELELPLRRADGQYRWFKLRSRPIRGDDGTVSRWVGVAMDIHDRRRAEQALRQGEETLRLREAQLSGVTDAMPQIVWSARADGCPDMYNAHWHRYTGMPRELPAGEAQSMPDWTGYLHPDDAPAAARDWQRSVETGQPYESEYRLRRHDGIHRWFIVRALPLRDASGGVVRWFGTCTDIEERKVAELLLEEADRLKDEFLAMLGHELRNPLAPMINALRALERAGAGPDSHRLCLDILHRQLAQMTRLVDGLLEVSRITQGRIALRPSDCDLADAVRAAVESVQPLIDARAQVLAMHLPDAPLRIRADGLRIVQAVTNLLHNASTYTQPGGRIDVSLRTDGKEAIVRVSDNGSGIAPALLPRIFDLFTQGERSLDRAQGGLGIGLALVRRLAQLHGGSVHAASEGPGRGATFTLRLPRARPEDARRTSPPEPDCPD